LANDLRTLYTQEVPDLTLNFHSEMPMNSLAALISPYNVDRFLQENWTKKALFVSGEGCKRFEHLFSWQQLNDLLNYRDLSAMDIWTATAERSRKFPAEEKPSVLLDRLRQGETLVINRVENLIPEIEALVSGFIPDIANNGAGVNVYCSWPGIQGLRCHYDGQDIFVMQIEGSKQWYVFRDTFKYPLREQISLANRELSPPDEDPYLVCTLNPGDLLYLPRGHWHYAIATDRPSLHLTFGITCRTGMNFLVWLAGQLRQREIWRQNMPMLSEENSAETLSMYLDELFQDLLEFCGSSEIDIVSEYQHYMQQADNALKTSPLYALPQIDPQE